MVADVAQAAASSAASVGTGNLGVAGEVGSDSSAFTTAGAPRPGAAAGSEAGASGVATIGRGSYVDQQQCGSLTCAPGATECQISGPDITDGGSDVREGVSSGLMGSGAGCNLQAAGPGCPPAGEEGLPCCPPGSSGSQIQLPLQVGHPPPHEAAGEAAVSERTLPPGEAVAGHTLPQPAAGARTAATAVPFGAGPPKCRHNEVSVVRQVKKGDNK